MILNRRLVRGRWTDNLTFVTVEESPNCFNIDWLTPIKNDELISSTLSPKFGCPCLDCEKDREKITTTLQTELKTIREERDFYKKNYDNASSTVSDLKNENTNLQQQLLKLQEVKTTLEKGTFVRRFSKPKQKLKIERLINELECPIEMPTGSNWTVKVRGCGVIDFHGKFHGIPIDDLELWVDRPSWWQRNITSRYLRSKTKVITLGKAFLGLPNKFLNALWAPIQNIILFSFKPELQGPTGFQGPHPPDELSAALKVLCNTNLPEPLGNIQINSSEKTPPISTFLKE